MRPHFVPNRRHYSQALHLHIHGQPTYNDTRASRYVRVCNQKSYILTSQTQHVMGSQKNHLNETILLRIQNMVKSKDN